MLLAGQELPHLLVDVWRKLYAFPARRYESCWLFHATIIT